MKERKEKNVSYLSEEVSHLRLLSECLMLKRSTLTPRDN